MGAEKNIYEHLADKEIDAWNQGFKCNCSDEDCTNNHRRCALCGYTVLFGAYEAMQPNSKYNWNIDHIIPISKFNSLIYNLGSYWQRISSINDLKNLQITHVYCNQNKGDYFNSEYKNGYGDMKNPDFN